jgi:ribosomal protein S18 acetylase RimI-like enzyme
MRSIQKADTTHISTIQRLAHFIWNITYKDILSKDQLNYMLELFYNEKALQQQMNDGHQFIIAIDENKITGFASYSKQNTSRYKLHKLYIHPGQQGKGTGKLLLEHIINDILNNNATQLEVNVNRYNKALQFYLKNGFEIIKEEDIDIGEGYFMNDYVLSRKLYKNKS